MSALLQKFAKLSTDYAPGQETRVKADHLHNLTPYEASHGAPVDFSHGDVDVTAFPPTPGALGEFVEGVIRGGSQAYTEYRGQIELREKLVTKLGRFTGQALAGPDSVIITPGTQGALFLAIGATVSAGDKVAIVQPDYFANRKLVEFLGGEAVPVRMDYERTETQAGIDLSALEDAFRAGVKVFLFSNPNNPTGVVYSRPEIASIAGLANRYGVTVIVDQLYSRLRYSGSEYVHLRAEGISDNNVVTIMGPSKTESLSGFRLGVAFGAPEIIERMEKLQAIVSLRAPGYSQAVLRTWFNEPQGWLDERIVQHQEIRDDLLRIFRAADGIAVRTPQAGSYLFPRLPALSIDHHSFARVLRHSAGVTVTPGTEFSPYSTQSIRLNFSQNREAASAAVHRLVKLVDEYRARKPGVC